jgi:ATP-dependent Clp protease ATP-binding subunit ClpA
VGKTELARALAQFLFDDEHAMIRTICPNIREAHRCASDRSASGLRRL